MLHTSSLVLRHRWCLAFFSFSFPKQCRIATADMAFVLSGTINTLEIV